MNTILETQNLTKQYGTGDAAVTALNACSIAIHKGKRLAIVGESGSGKSTLLHLLGALDSPTGGDVFFNGSSLYEKNDTELSLYRRQNIGFVFQNYNLVPELTVQENILLPLMIDKKSVDKDYFQFILSTLALEDRLRHLPGELSGGQQQRADIARAFIHKPPVLLCDEPTGNLDSKNSREVLDLLLDLTAQTQITLIVVTHDEKIAHAMDSILVIHDGHIRRELS